MIVEETFYRPPELSREARTLPAETYNLARTLLRRAAHGCLFVPVRRLQYLAVLDDEEFIFVDGVGRRLIELSWQRFAPQARTSLEEPVAYEAVCYSSAAADAMGYVQTEFHKAMKELQDKIPRVAPARIIKLSGKSS